jgi:uncharacterized membrane protein YqjE
MAENANRSIGEVLQDAVGHVQEIVQSEIRLAKTEIREQAGKAKHAAIMFGGAALMAFFAAALVVTAAACALAIVLPWWAATLVVGALCGMIGGGMFAAGRMRIKMVHGPQDTIQTVNENLKWARNQTR